MNDSDAREVYRDLFLVFPGIHTWLERLDNADEVYASWRSMMSTVDKHDAAMVLDALRAGTYSDYPAGTEPDRWPVWIIQRCREYSGERYERAETARIGKQARGGIDQHRLIDLLGRKVHERENPEAAAKAIQFRDPHYQCDICRDTGAVEVWALVVHWKLATGKPIDRLQTETAACTCDRGLGLRTANPRWTPSATYDPAKFCRTSAPSWADLAELVTWMEALGVMVLEPVKGGRFAEQPRLEVVR